jgi:hypothetical protein
MTHGVGQDAAKDASDDIAHEPSSMAKRLFGTFVPHRNDDRQSWTDGSFCDSKEESDGK